MLENHIFIFKLSLLLFDNKKLFLIQQKKLFTFFWNLSSVCSILFWLMVCFCYIFFFPLTFYSVIVSFECIWHLFYLYQNGSNDLILLLQCTFYFTPISKFFSTWLKKDLRFFSHKNFRVDEKILINNFCSLEHKLSLYKFFNIVMWNQQERFNKFY